MKREKEKPVKVTVREPETPPSAEAERQFLEVLIRIGRRVQERERQEIIAKYREMTVGQPPSPEIRFLDVASPVPVGHEFEENGRRWRVGWCVRHKSACKVMVYELPGE